VEVVNVVVVVNVVMVVNVAVAVVVAVSINGLRLITKAQKLCLDLSGLVSS